MDTPTQLQTKLQLSTHVRQHILDLLQELPAGAQLPSEARLVERLGVSRVTVREALSHLERDGRIIRRHGIGTFAAPAPIRLGTTLNEVTPIPEMIRASGYTPSMHLFETTELKAPADAATLLGAHEGQPVPTIRILFHADHQPAVFITYYLSRIVFTDHNASPSDRFDGNMVNWVESATGRPIQQTHARIAAIAGQQDIVHALNMPEGAPLLKFTTIAYLIDGRAAYQSISYQDSALLAVNVVRTRTNR